MAIFTISNISDTISTKSVNYNTAVSFSIVNGVSAKAEIIYPGQTMEINVTSIPANLLICKAKKMITITEGSNSTVSQSSVSPPNDEVKKNIKVKKTK